MQELENWKLPQTDREALLSRYKRSVFEKTRTEAEPMKFFVSYSMADALDALARDPHGILHSRMAVAE
jgi:hypothetical protein